MSCRVFSSITGLYPFYVSGSHVVLINNLSSYCQLSHVVTMLISDKIDIETRNIDKEGRFIMPSRRYKNYECVHIYKQSPKTHEEKTD